MGSVPSPSGRATSACVVAALFIAFGIAACGPGAKYPPTAAAVYCTSAVDDCEEQSTQLCPGGYRTLDRESFTPPPWHRRMNEWYHLIRHDKIVIECEVPNQPTKDQSG